MAVRDRTRINGCASLHAAARVDRPGGGILPGRGPRARDADRRDAPRLHPGPHPLLGLGELLFFEPYGESQFEATLQFARKWGLDKNIRDESYENLIAPVSV